MARDKLSFPAVRLTARSWIRCGFAALAIAGAALGFALSVTCVLALRHFGVGL